MLNKNLQLICQKYYYRFHKVKTVLKSSPPNLIYLQKKAQEATCKARENYSKLTEPKICSLETYINIWGREVLDQEFSLKTFRKVHLEKPSKNQYSQILASLFNLLPLELVPYLKNEVFNAPLSQRQKNWQNFNLPLTKIKNLFKRLILSRNKEARKIGYPSLTDQLLEKNKISKNTYLLFVKNIDGLIKSLNQELPKTKIPSMFYSPFNLPCFICQLYSFPFQSLQEVFEFVAKEYPVIKKFRQKIKIKTKDKYAFCFYEKEKDVININIEKKVNIRHQSILLIHELSHAISFLNYLGRGKDLLFIKGKYGAEKEAIKIEMKLLKKISDQLYRARLGEILLFYFLPTLFEIEVYKKPNQDLSKLYAQTFNRCFLKAKQRTNSLYLLNQEFIARPFAFFPHAIAAYQFLKTLQ